MLTLKGQKELEKLLAQEQQVIKAFKKGARRNEKAVALTSTHADRPDNRACARRRIRPGSNSNQKGGQAHVLMI